MLVDRYNFYKLIGRYFAISVCSLLFLSVLWTMRGLQSITGVDKMLVILCLLPIITLIAGIGLCCGRSRTKKYRVGWMDILFAMSLVYLIINYYCLNGIATTKLIVVISLFIIYYDFRIVLSLFPQLKSTVIILFLVLIFIEAIIGILQLQGLQGSNHPLFKITGTFMNPGPYAGYIAILTPLAIYHLLVSDKLSSHTSLVEQIKNNLVTWLAWAALFSTIAILPATEARTAWAAFLVSVVVLVCRETNWYSIAKRYLLRQRFLLYLCLLVSIMAIILLSVVAYQMKPNSANGRLLMWKITSQVIIENPLLGVGFGNFKGAYAEKQAEYFMKTERSAREQHVAGSPDYAFNDYLQIFAELGLIGFCFFLALVYGTLKGLAKQKDGLFYVAIGLLVICISSYPFNILSFGVIAFFLAAVGSQNLNPIRGFQLPYQLITIIVFTIGCLSFNLWALQYGLKYNRAIQQWGLLRPAYLNGGQKSICYQYEMLEDILYDENRFVIEYADCLLQTRQTDLAKNLLHKYFALFNDPQAFILMAQIHQALLESTQAEWYLKEAVYHSPNRIYALYLLSEFYCNNDDVESGILLAKRALNIVPKISSAETKMIRHKLQQLILSRNNK